MTNTPPEVLERMQSDFIEHMKNAHSTTVYFAGGQLLVPKGQGRYVPVIAHSCWNTWCAARQSAVIELPPPIKSDGFSYWHDFELVSALECQGYRVEVKSENI